MINRLLCSAFLGFCFVTAAVGQSSSSVSGTTTDPTGAVVPDASVTLVNNGTAATRTGHTDPQGHYEFAQVAPGAYTITANHAGFGSVTANVQLVVSTPSTVNLVFKGAATNETVDVTTTTAQVNTTDATLGAALTNRPIVQLPVEGHDVTSLLALQPGVTFISVPDPGTRNDPRSGSVNGGKTDQANVLLDGVDSNDQLQRTSFTSVLRVTPDSVQEFRTITSNPGAELGFSSGAQVTIVTKSGSNAFHGVLYEYNRNTSLEANSFLNKQSTPVVPRKALIRNVFGGAGGGPIVKDRLFFFVSYEGRRDRSAQTQRRVVPTASFSEGNFSYTDTSGGTSVLTPAQVAAIDPLHIGAPASIATPGTIDTSTILGTLQAYPLPNSVGGDTINTEGYTFNAPAPLTYNTYFARFDYHDRSGRNSIFWRGNYQLDNYANGAPQFDHLRDGTKEPNSSVYENFSKGFAAGYDWIATPNLVNALRFGFTRQSVATTGTQTQSASVFDSGTITPLYAVGGATTTQAGGFTSANQLPVYDIRDDVNWTKGRHAVGFGGEIFLSDNSYQSNSHSFDSSIMDGAYLYQDGGQLLATPANAMGAAPAEKTLNYEVEFANLLGLETKLQRESNFDLNGNALPNGAMVKRTFSQKHFDLYLQDSWKIKPNLTLTAGVRYTMAPAIRETHGYNVAATEPLGGWFNERAELAATGQSQALAGPVSYDLSKTLGEPLYNFQRDWAPRASFAYAPKGDSSLMRFFTGGQQEMSIRGGFGMYYDAFGQALAQAYSSAVGFSTLTQTGPGTQIPDAPRYTGFNDIPTSSPLFPAAVAGGFPQTPPSGAHGEDTTIDSTIRGGYTMVDNLTVERQFKGGYLLTVSYVGRQSRRSLIGEDMAEPTNLIDPQSGMSFYQAARILGTEAQQNASNPSYIAPTVPFFQDLWPGAASTGVSATQAIYQDFVNNLNDWTSASLAFDGDCIPSCSKLGPNTMWNSQFAALYALRSVGMGSYNSGQVSLHKAFLNGYEFSVNYTYSHCIDLGSSPEISGSEGGSGAVGTIRNSWSPKQSRASCDYDLRHQFQANGTFDLPFGKGRRFGGASNGLVNALIGGWEVTTIFRATTGFPGSVSNSVGYPTVWDTSGFATQIGPLPSKGPRGEMFSNRAAAYAAFAPTYAGESGTRNDLRGDGLFTWDGGVDKTWKLFTVRNDPNTLQFRVEGFNLTNSARFDISTSNASLDYGTPATFGKYEGPNQLIDPRVFQAVLRYTF